MADLPLIQLPMPEEEQPQTLYGRITNTNEPPKYDDIQNSNLPKEEKVRQIQYRTKAYQDDLDRQLHKDYARMGLGTALSGASFHPIFNVPYVGTGIGGAMYDLGQGIVEGDTAPDLWNRAKRGFAIGETVGAIPYVGKGLGKTKAGQAVINSAPIKAVGNVLNKAGERFTNSKLYDALMTDVRAFNPNKQTAYHGSPYDFNKFSNEAIGTGEGAQAHGLGHYAALNKDVAEGYKNKLSEEYNSPILQEYNELKKHRNLLKELEKRVGLTETVQNGLENTNKRILEIEKTYPPSSLKDKGQLYKLSIPKDDVMLREGARLDKQPQIVQDAFNQIRQEYLNLPPLESNDELIKYFENNLQNGIDDFFEREATKNALRVLNGEKLSANGWQDLNNLNYQDLHKLDAYFTNGEDILKRLQNQFWDKPNKEELAQKILYDKGIKGISYNGGIDGEARVIFNPDDIVIGRKYYNQPNLYQQLTGKQNTGALVDALLNR